MNPERPSRRHVLLMVLVGCCLFLAGTGHAGLHADDEGAECPACALVGDAPPEAGPALAPVRAATTRVAVVPEDPVRILPRVSVAPRGPPAVC